MALAFQVQLDNADWLHWTHWKNETLTVDQSRKNVDQ